MSTQMDNIFKIGEKAIYSGPVEKYGGCAVEVCSSSGTYPYLRYTCKIVLGPPGFKFLDTLDLHFEKLWRGAQFLDNIRPSSLTKLSLGRQRDDN